MSQILPTVLILLLTALIGLGLYVMVQRLDSMGGEGHGVKGKAEQPDKMEKQ